MPIFGQRRYIRDRPNRNRLTLLVTNRKYELLHRGNNLPVALDHKSGSLDGGTRVLHGSKHRCVGIQNGGPKIKQCL